LKGGSILTMKMEDYDLSMDTNVKSIINLTQLCVPHLIATKGTIVNVSSVTGSRSFPNVLPYCISKAALDQFTKCIALELADKGVRVNSVNPGVTITQLHKRSGQNDEQYAKVLLN
jgi:NAD(P)-dependent dehydrogenase (short-subunit alcohol dehydrogenase family)